MLGIVIVTYKSYDRISDYVEKDLKPCPMEKKIIVVDVGSPRESAERMAALLGVHVSSEDTYPKGDVTVLHVEDNLGYARGNNFGVRYLLRHVPSVDKLLFSNDDIRFLTPRVLETMAETLDRHPEAAVVGPDILDLQDRHQTPAYDRPSIWYNIVNHLCEPFFGQTFAASFFRKSVPQLSSGPVAYVCGCCMMAGTADFVAAGMFDERTFLYWEEAILDRRLEAIGKCYYCNEDVQIRHFIGASISAGEPTLLPVRNMVAGTWLYHRYYQKHGWAVLSLLWLSGFLRIQLVRLALMKRRVKRSLGLGNLRSH